MTPPTSGRQMGSARRTKTAHGRPPGGSAYDRTALVLQGGGALGAYQGGVYEALAEAGYLPDWIAGISIGAINAAIIAGNPPHLRAERLEQFWHQVTAADALSECMVPFFDRRWVNGLSASRAALSGAPGFFTPRSLWADGTLTGDEPPSVYSTRPLRETLEALVDFDRINAGGIRLSLGAVNVRTGNFVYFDSDDRMIGPEHVMASGSLPPYLPAVEIDGEFYWDGGLVSNTPLHWILGAGEGPDRDTLVFQVDLWSARGHPPADLMHAEERRKDVIYSSRTRLNTDLFRREQRLRQSLRRVIERLPEDERSEPDVQRIQRKAERCRNVSIVHLIYNRKPYDTQHKDYAFSRAAMCEHWAAGGDDVARSLRDRRWERPPPAGECVRVYDVNVDQDRPDQPDRSAPDEAGRPPASTSGAGS